MKRRTKYFGWVVSLTLASLGGFTAASAQAVNGSPWLTAYHPTWWYGVLKPDMIDFNSMTHIAIFPAQDALATAPYFNSAGIDDGSDYPRIVTLAHAKGVKVLISAVGGYGQVNMPIVAADPVKCQAFVDAACAFAKSKKADGIELDWEFPRASDIVGWNRLIRLFRQRLDTWSPRGILATSMFYSIGGKNSPPFYRDSMMVFDQINLMSYTMWMGSSEGPFRSGFDTPVNTPAAFPGYKGWSLNTVGGGPLTFIAAGYPASKLGLGVSFEGTRFDGVTTMGKEYTGWAFTSSVTNPLSTGYQAIPAAGRVWDPVAQANYCVSGTSVYSFQDTNSVKAIAAWARDQKWGGFMVYDIGTGYDKLAPVPDAMLKVAGRITLAAAPAAPAPTAPRTTIYSDHALASPWTTTGTYAASLDLANTEKIFTGYSSIKVSASAWAGVLFRLGDWNSVSTIDPMVYDSLRVALHGGALGVSLSLCFLNISGAAIGSRKTLTIPPNTWSWHVMPVKEFLPNGTRFTSLMLQVSQSTPAEFYIDELVLAAKASDGSNVTQSLSLRTGWTMISSYLSPNTTSLTALFEPVTGSGTMVKNSAGEVYWPDLNINTIGAWNPLSGYLLYTDTTQSFTITGTIIDPEKSPLSLVPGVNIVPYLRSTPMTPQLALAGLNDSSVVVYDENGNIYWPSQGTATLISFFPGCAYAIFVTTPKSFTYPANTAPAGSMNTGGVESVPLLKTHYRTRLGRSSVSSVMLFVSSALRDGDEVAIRSARGDVVGLGVCDNGRAAVTVSGDDPLTPGVIEGARENEALSVEIRPIAGGSALVFAASGTVDLLSKIHMPGPAVRFHAGTVDIVNGTSGRTAPVSHALGRNYPNPFNPTTSIPFEIAEPARVRLRVFDVLGRTVDVLVNRDMTPGSYAVEWSAKKKTSSVYFYSLEAGGFSDVRRMVVQK